MHHDYDCWGMHDGWWGAPGFWIAVLALAVLFVYLLVRSTRRVGSFKESPLDILKRRYANGELTTEEFEERKKTLRTN